MCRTKMELMTALAKRLDFDFEIIEYKDKSSNQIID